MIDPHICHIIVAAGSGTRFGAKMPKQFASLGGRPVLMTTIERMRRFGHNGDIILVLHKDWTEPWHEMCRAASFDSPEVVTGGITRWESVRNALKAMPYDTDIVTVHDGARPLLTSKVIDNALDALAAGAAGAIPVIAVTDSLRTITPDGTNHAVDRSLFRTVQTPQVFRADILAQSYRLPWQPSFTDDASVVEAAFPDIRLKLTQGDTANIKITHPDDLLQAELLLERLS